MLRLRVRRHGRRVFSAGCYGLHLGAILDGHYTRELLSRCSESSHFTGMLVCVFDLVIDSLVTL